MLAFRPKGQVMTRPPRDPDQPLLTGWLVRRTLLVSPCVASAWWLFAWELDNGAGLHEGAHGGAEHCSSSSGVLSVQLVADDRPWRVGMFANRWIILGDQCAGHPFAIHISTRDEWCSTPPIDIGVWVRLRCRDLS